MADKTIFDLEELLDLDGAHGMVIDTGEETFRVLLSTIKTFVQPETFYIEDDTNWDGVETTVTYDVSATVTDARLLNWTLKNVADNYKQIGCEIDFPTATSVRVVVGIPLDAGTYTLSGR